MTREQNLEELGSRIERLKKEHVPDDEPQPSTEPPVSCCPRCQAPLVHGHLSIHGTVWNFLMVGFSHAHAWFAPEGDERREEVVVHKQERRLASRCTQCDTLIVFSEPSHHAGFPELEREWEPPDLPA